MRAINSFIFFIGVRILFLLLDVAGAIDLRKLGLALPHLGQCSEVTLSSKCGLSFLPVQRQNETF